MATITYAELTKRLDSVKLFNKAPELDPEIYDGLKNGNLEECDCGDPKCDIWGEANHEKTQNEIFQWYLISPSDADYLKNVTDEVVFYSDVLDEYVWGVTHFGTPWDNVELEVRQ
jgi:hypothetical protein